MSSCGCQTQQTTTCSSTGCKPCKGNATICHFVVETFEEARQYRNSYVFVESENATYHVDGNGNPLEVNRQPIFENNHTPVEDAYRGQLVFDFASNLMYIYDLGGNYKQATLS